MNAPRLKRLLLEVLVVVAIVASLEAWRARDLLPAGDRASAPPFELHDLDGNGRISSRAVGYTTAPGLWLRTRGL